MEERQLRMGVVLLAVLAVLLVLYWQWTPAEDDTDPDATVPVWHVDGDQITKLEIERADGRVVLAEHPDGWHLEEPVQDVADAKEVGYLVDELSRIEKGVGIPDADPAEFGLGDPPTVRATVTLDDGSTKTLDIGDEAPVGWRTYARAADGSVVAVAGVAGKKFQVGVDDLRDARMLRFDIAAVRRVVVQSADGTLDVSGEGKTWWLQGFSRADPTKVEDLLTDLADVRFDQISPTDLAPDGIADPKIHVTLELQGATGDVITRELAVGDPAPLGTLVRTDAGRSGWAVPESLKFLGRGPKDIGDSHAFAVDPESDDEISVKLGDLTWSAARTEDGWQANGGDARKQVDEITKVTLQYRPTAPPAPTDTWGTVTASEGDTTRTVRIGQVVEAGYRTAVDERGGQPYLVEQSELEDLATALSEPDAATSGSP